MEPQRLSSITGSTGSSCSCKCCWMCGLILAQLYKSLISKDGWCIHYDKSSRKCSIYDDSASMGAALRAAHGWLCNKKGKFVPMSCMYMDKLQKTSLNCKLAVTTGDLQLASKYALFVKKRMEIENRLIQRLGQL